jgi:D-aminoacyl-tRNA deacylase
MRAVVQRVSRASVKVDERIVGEIEAGLLVLLGIAQDDSESDADCLAEKITGLRIFEDADGKMNLSVVDIAGGAHWTQTDEKQIPRPKDGLVMTKGAILAVSQFTLFGDVRRGKRPSFDAAARPEQAKKLYEYFVERVRGAGVRCETGTFQAMMKVELANEGPVTILLDSKKLF